jgi:hypothetical protein
LDKTKGNLSVYLKINKVKLKRQFIAVLAILSSIVINAQETSIENTDRLNKNAKPAFLEFSIGLSSASFTDFATSPIKYSGYPLDVMLAHTEINTKRTSRFGLNYIFGNFFNDFNSQNSKSQFKSITMSYSELFRVGFLSANKLNTKIGGHLNTTANLRQNERLFNSSKGIEVIGTLFGSINTTLNMSKTKFLKRELFFNADIGLINSSYRNGYAYVGQGALLNNDDFFDGYQFSLFSGARFSTQLGFTGYLKNSNAIQVSYLWDAYRTTRDANNFQMAYHTIRLICFLNLK